MNAPSPGSLRLLPQALKQALAQLELRALRLGRGPCPLCAGALQLRFSFDPLGTRCLSCGASAISMAIGSVLQQVAPDLADRRVLELSSRGPLHAFLGRSVAGGSGSLSDCEYFDDLEPGEWRGGVQCQDVQRLTHADASFDLCTHTEVFEHVPDDARGFCEILRVLAPGGLMVFTAPLFERPATLERARLEAGEIVHLESPSYHDDLIRGSGQVLVYRDYGLDLPQRIQDAGFGEARILRVADPAGFGCVHPVIVARKL